MKTLELEKGEIEHPLFRACMQLIVSTRQNHPDDVKQAAANRLEALAKQYADFRT